MPDTLQDHARRCGVKQFVAIVRSHATGKRFSVYTCGDDHYYLFTLMASREPGDTRMTDLSFPVRRKDLRPEIRRALAQGVGNSPEPFYSFLPPGVTWRDVRKKGDKDA
jgi:hypothetical protein